jgi:hypothetical protein
MAQNPYYVEPANIMPGLSAVASAIKGRGARELEAAKERKVLEREEQKEAEAQAKREEGARLLESGTPDEIAAFMAKNPEAGKTLSGAMKFKSEETKQRLLDKVRGIYTGQLDPLGASIEHAESLIQEGADPSDTMELAKIAAQSPEMGREEAGRIWAGLKPEEFMKAKQAMGEAVTGPDSTKIGAQEILEDGTVIQSTPKGTVVYNPEGERVRGKAAADAVATARAQKISNVRKAAGEKKTASLEAEQDLKAVVESGVISAKDAAKISTKAFDRLEGINQNIRNIDEAIALIDGGAQTGVVESRLPSIRQASVKLDNLQGRLGLDVLRTTTFGALSAAELKFALDTALPKGLQPDELKSWLIEKRAAQEKLSDYIESAAIYLGTPGNTVAGLIAKNRAKQRGAEPEKTPGAQPPTLQEFLQKAATVNPGVTEQELINYYNTEYGGL